MMIQENDLKHLRLSTFHPFLPDASSFVILTVCLNKEAF